MLTYTIYTLITIPITYLTYDIFIVKNNNKSKYNKICELYNTIYQKYITDTQQTSSNASSASLYYIQYKSIRDTFYTIFLMKKQQYLNSFFNMREPIDQNHSAIKYYIGNNMYKIIIDHNKSDSIYFNVAGYKNGTIVDNSMNTIHQYMGPRHDFHGRKMTPLEMGFDQVTMTVFIDGEFVNKVYDNHDVITLNTDASS